MPPDTTSMTPFTVEKNTEPGFDRIEEDSDEDRGVLKRRHKVLQLIFDVGTHIIFGSILLLGTPPNKFVFRMSVFFWSITVVAGMFWKRHIPLRKRIDEDIFIFFGFLLRMTRDFNDE